ncbi:TetR/AcrR family transcriptional regulator [Mycobacterium yunnanensis]|uniref:TetR/AcrR family transcriptional regulator n=1 Tax=Mycobacterium yunnanensis TaxID=368477 RepID=A0A9X2ZBL9_9MYCO|nr:TetR/AcrR family transcriptional regulator [Mycobacterium yunnanensis]MCV7424800.1 TetR/AcrR family transcriptional regulator [Mycobacterium yunnanensis]
MTTASEPSPVDEATVTSADRIRHAALANFAKYGTAATSLRAVAASAGVSLGMVQHHYATKSSLIKAVDDYVLALLIGQLSAPIPDPPADSITDIGSRVSGIIAEHPDVAAYVSRAMVDGSPLGATLFDALMEVGMARWELRAERGETRPDVDLTWATINALVLAVGAISLRAHVDRHLPEPFTSPEQLQRWQNATDTLLREGLLGKPADG